MSEDFPVLSAKNTEFMTQDRHSLPTGWTDFYEHCVTKYKGLVYPLGSTTKVGSSRKW